MNQLPFFDRAKHLHLNYLEEYSSVQLMNDLLELKIFEPYFISNQMIEQFEVEENKFGTIIQPEKYSIIDILKKHHREGKKATRVFMRVNLNEDIDNRLTSF